MARPSERHDGIDRTIPFVDAHHHLWELGRLDYPWLTEPGTPGQDSFLGDYKAIRVDWGTRRLLREHYGQQVSATVHVEAACSPEQAVAETAWLESEAAQHAIPTALVVFCDLTRPDAAAVLEAHVTASARARSVRARPEETGDPAFRRGLVAVAGLGLSYEFSRSPGALTDGLALAEFAPDLQIIVGHAGLPLRRDPEYRDLWRHEMRALAAAPSIAVKISGFGMTDHVWSIESIRPWVLDTIEAFGVERSMFGTNWPVDSLYSSYFELVDAYRLILEAAGLSNDEQHALLHGNAERIYRL